MADTQQAPWRIVLDTASLISGVRSQGGAARELLRLVIDRKIVIVMDLKLLLEYHAVALRFEHLEASGSSSEQMAEFIELLVRYAEPVDPVPLLRPLSVDPNDDMVLELAVAAAATAIITNNKRHFQQARSAFGILVMTPAELLANFERKQP